MMPARLSDRRRIGGERPGLAERVGLAIDQWIGTVAPGWSLQRKVARMRGKMADRVGAKFGGSYRSADKSRVSEAWISSALGPDDDLLPDLPTLRERSRERCRNDGSARGASTRIVSNVIGSGIRPEPAPDAKALGVSEDQAKEWAEACSRAWRNWVPHADATGRLDFYGLQRLWARQEIENGDVGVHPVHLSEPGRAHPLALETIEGDRIDSPATRAKNGNRINMGVELGARGEPLAYWVMPGYRSTATGYHDTSQNPTRIPKSKDGRPTFIHVFDPRRPGQTRGEPLFAPVLWVFELLDGYMEAEMLGARAGACIMGFVESQNPALTLAGATNDRDDVGNRLQDMSPGAMHYLAPGEKVQLANPQRPGQTFNPFVTRCLRLIGSGIDLPYEILALDFSDVNYTSSRSAQLEARRKWRIQQDQYIAQVYQPIWRLFIEDSYQAGLLPAVPGFFEKLDEWTACNWIPPAWGWVDPEVEIRSSVLAIQGNLSTLTEECAAQGRRAVDVVRLRAIEEHLLKEAGLPPMAAVSATGGSQPSQAGAAAGKPGAAKKPQPAGATSETDE